MPMRPAAFLEVYVDQLEGLDLSALCAANRVSGASLCVRLTVTAGHRCLGVAQTKPVNPGESSCVVFNELLQIAIFEQHVDIRVGVVSAEESIALHRTDSQTNDLTGAFLAAAQLPTSAMASALIDGSRCDADTPATSTLWTAPDTAPVAAWALFEQQNWQRARHPAALSLDSSRGAAGGAGAGGACLGGVFDKGARMGCFAGLADPLWQRGLSQASGDDDDDDEVSSTFRGDGSLSHVPELAGGVVSMGGGRAQACASPTRSSQIPRKSVGREAENADMAVDLLLNELLDAQTLAERAEDCGGATGGGSVDGAEEGQGEFCGGAEEGEGESCGGFCCRGEARKGRCALSVSRLSLPCDFDTEGDCVGDCDGDCDDDCDGDCDDDCDGDCDGACDDGGDDYDGEKPHDWAEDVTEMQEEVIREYCQHHHQRQQKQREQETHKLEIALVTFNLPTLPL
ncbi:unnamed protein product [Closterium sp. Naga37s-1]|nr:unnamed protein product [Closterium sp. Naga37s-1]